jgi:hypothetical protein
MDPYLEHPALWPGVHNRLIAALDEDLSTRLPAEYLVSVEERVYIVEVPEVQFVGRPDLLVAAAPETQHGSATLVAIPTETAGTGSAGGAGGAVLLEAEVPVPDTIRETYLEIRDAATGDVVTVVALLSPANKRPGAGRSEYQAKRLRTLGTLTNLVEIDLLRGGEPLPVRLRDAPDAPPPGDYRILIARADRRPAADLHAFGLRDAIPAFALPLRARTAGIRIELRGLLDTVYDRSRYAQRIDYRTPPVPPLDVENAAWADALLREKGLR